MDLSVIIPSLNAARTIATQLEALATQKWSRSWEVIIADNGSCDETLEIVRQYRNRLPGLRIVEARERRGAAHARNVGVAAAASRNVVFCDADDEVAPGWVAAIGEALFEHGFVASRFDTGKLNHRELQRVLGNPQYRELQKLWYSPFLPHAGGSGMGVKREIHDAVGGFDETLLRLSDTDYCVRIQKRGIRLHFVEDAVVNVRCRDSLRALYRQSRGFAEYNVLLYKRYRTSATGSSALWSSYVRDWIALLRALRGIHREQGRGVLAWRLGRQIGRLVGSVKHWVPPV
ncbi:MAG TPA: glycosyltransferase [candidate division Zixibacteria bacterium]|nr:glycosyltransferase [candidate division Zixibacteria bacterium]